MGDVPERIARDVPALFDVESLPSEYRSAYTATEGVTVVAGRVDEDGDQLEILLVDGEASPRRQQTVERAMDAWERYEERAGIVPVVASGTSPRRWIAIEPWARAREGRQGTETVPTVRSILTDLAEAFVQIERSAEDSIPAQRHSRIDPQTGTATVCWPLGERSDDADERAPVRQLGAVGYELLTDDSFPAEDSDGQQKIEPSTELSRTIEASLSVDSGRISSVYAFKRAVLFGLAAPTAEKADSRPADPSLSSSNFTPIHDPFQSSPRPETSQQRHTARNSSPAQARADADDITDQLRRRTVVGVLGLGMLGATGLLRAREEGTDDSQQASDTPPVADFSFFQSDGTLEITHDGGDEIVAGRLVIRNPRYSGVGAFEWSEFPGFDETSTVGPGDSIRIDMGVQGMWWIRVVWRSPTDNTELILDEREISEEDLF